MYNAVPPQQPSVSLNTAAPPQATAHLENVTMAASNLVSMRTTEGEAVGAPPRKRGRPALTATMSSSEAPQTSALIVGDHDDEDQVIMLRGDTIA